MYTSDKKKSAPKLLGTVALITAGALPGTALALTFEAGEWQFDLDTVLTAAAQWRTESRDKTFSTDPAQTNFNDGNNNFDAGSLTSAKGSFLVELLGQYNNFSFFIRGDGLYDYVYQDKKSDMSRENFLTYNNGILNGGDLKRGEFPDETLDEHGKRMRLLEAYATYEFNLESQGGSVRLGRQVIAWGEGIVYSGANALQNPVDGSVALSPGVDLKEVFLPTASIDLKWNFNPNISSEAYYRLDWEETTLPGVGSFLAPADILGPGAERAIAGPGSYIPVIGADKPDDDGQWGVLLRYATDGSTTFTLSRSRSHANKPGAEIGLGAESYYREVYLEDIDVWQFGIATIWGDASVFAEFSYSDNVPFSDGTGYISDAGQFLVTTMTRGHYRQMNVGFLDSYTALPWLAERIDLIFEATYQSNNLGGDDIEDTPYGVTDDAWGYSVITNLNSFSVLPGLDVTTTFVFQHVVDGYGASVMNSLADNQKSASAGVHFNYLDNWEFDAKYTWWFGNDDFQSSSLDDRDNFGIYAKYKF